MRVRNIERQRDGDDSQHEEPHEISKLDVPETLLTDDIPPEASRRVFAADEFIFAISTAVLMCHIKSIGAAAAYPQKPKGDKNCGFQAATAEAAPIQHPHSITAPKPKRNYRL